MNYLQHLHLMSIEGDRVFCSVCGWGEVIPKWKVVDDGHQLELMGEAFRAHFPMQVEVTSDVIVHN